MQELNDEPQSALEANQQSRLLASYVPKILLKKFQLKPEVVKIPEIEIIRAAVVFADISGFTPLAEKMNKKGKTGIELMTMHLNRFFDKLIGIIHLYGGDIIKFAGDAVMVIWPDDIIGSRLAKNVNYACQCAMEMQAQLHNFECEGVILRLHIGIGSGKLGLVHVGGESGAMEFLITGDPLRQVGDCEKAANPGEVFISREAATLIDKNAIFGGKRGKKAKLAKIGEEQGEIMLCGVSNPEPPKPSDSLPETYSPQLRSCILPYISKSITYRLGQDNRTLDVCAMRWITVIFVNLDFIYVRGLKELHLLQKAVASMQKDIFQFDGAVRQFLIDDKGSVMIGVFGAPPCAHENDTSRAVMASIQLQGNLQRELQLQCRIGITTGYAFVGDVGNTERREYAMVGDIVNLSARLMGKCQLGSILVDKATYLGSIENPRISFEALPPIMVKGKAKEIEIFRPSQENASGFSVVTTSKVKLSKMVGRKQHLSQLHKAFNSVLATKKPSTALIQGEAGLGKTLLVKHFLLDIASQHPVTIFEGSGDSVEQKTPFYPWRGVFSAVLELFRFTNKDPQKYCEGIKKWLESNIPECVMLYPLLGDMYPSLVCDETKETLTLEAHQRQDTLFNLLARIIQIANEGDKFTIISLDNAQWFDRLSWALLAHLIEKCTSPICFVLVLRPMQFRPAEIKRIKKSTSSAFIQLKEMSEADLLEIVRLRLHVEMLPPILEGLLKSKLAQYPNPLLAQETADQLKEKGLVVIEETTGQGTVNLGLLAAGNTLVSEIVPSSLHGIYTSKIDHLMTYEQLVLRYASAIGSFFSVELLVNILPIPTSFLIARRDPPEDRREHMKSPRRALTTDHHLPLPSPEGKHKSLDEPKRRRDFAHSDGSVGSSSVGSSSPRDEIKKGIGESSDTRDTAYRVLPTRRKEKKRETYSGDSEDRSDPSEKQARRITQKRKTKRATLPRFESSNHPATPTQQDLFNFMFGDAQNSEPIYEVPIMEDPHPHTPTSPPNTNTVMTEKDVYNYIFQGGTIDEIVSDTKPKASLVEPLKLPTKTVKDKKVTQQDMFNYMFGGEKIETLIKEVDEDDRATESSNEDRINHNLDSEARGSSEQGNENSPPESDTLRLLEIKNQMEADVRKELERITNESTESGLNSDIADHTSGDSLQTEPLQEVKEGPSRPSSSLPMPAPIPALQLSNLQVAGDSSSGSTAEPPPLAKSDGTNWPRPLRTQWNLQAGKGMLKFTETAGRERRRSLRRLSDPDGGKEVQVAKLRRKHIKTSSVQLPPPTKIVEPAHVNTAQDIENVIDIFHTLKDHVAPTENRLIFKFRQPTLRQVFVETMLPSKLPAIHTKIAEYLEEKPDACPQPAVKHLAYHWRKAGRPDKAIIYYSQRVDTAMREFMHRKATKLLLKTIALQETLYQGGLISESELRPEMAVSNLEKWHRQLGETFYNLGEFSNAQLHLSKALEVTAQGLPEAQTICSPTLEHFDQDHFQEIKNALQEKAGKTKIKKSPMSSSSEMVRIYLGFAQVYFYKSRSVMLKNFSLHALSIAESLGLGSAELCRALASNVLASSISKNEPMIDHYSRLGQFLFKDAWSRRAWQLEGIARSGAANWKQGNLLLSQALKHSETGGDFRTVEECSLHLSWNYFFLGDFKNAGINAELSFQQACNRGDLQMQIMSLLSLANLAYSCGKIEIFYQKLQTIEAYLGPGIRYELTETDKILYYGLLSLKHVKLKDEKMALEIALMVDEVLESKDVQPTVWFTVMGVYYSFLAKANVIKMCQVSKKESFEKTGVKYKKIVASTQFSLKKIEEFSSKFRATVPVFSIAGGIFDQINNKKSSLFLSAVESATTHELKYFVAIAHHWITVFITISDNAQAQTRVNHVNRAANLFAEMDVYETMLVWIHR